MWLPLSSVNEEFFEFVLTCLNKYLAVTFLTLLRKLPKRGKNKFWMIKSFFNDGSRLSFKNEFGVIK